MPSVESALKKSSPLARAGAEKTRKAQAAALAKISPCRRRKLILLPRCDARFCSTGSKRAAGLLSALRFQKRQERLSVLRFRHSDERHLGARQERFRAGDPFVEVFRRPHDLSILDRRRIFVVRIRARLGTDDTPKIGA